MAAYRLEMAVQRQDDGVMVWTGLSRRMAVGVQYLYAGLERYLKNDPCDQFDEHPFALGGRLYSFD